MRHNVRTLPHKARAATITGTATYFATRRRKAPPWFLIAKEYAKGRPIEFISKQYHIPVKEIEKRLQLAISTNPDEDTIDSGTVTKDGTLVKIRNDSEIAELSRQVRHDLSGALAMIVRDFTNAELSIEDTDNLKALIDAGCKLFGWNLQKEFVNPAPLPSHAVNLALIHTTPEQLKAMGAQQAAQDAQHQADSPG